MREQVLDAELALQHGPVLCIWLLAKTLDPFSTTTGPELAAAAAATVKQSPICHSSASAAYSPVRSDCAAPNVRELS